MDTYTLVRPEYLNHYGYLFGGQLLKWVDEYTWMVASRDFPGHSLVTRAMDEIDFKTRVVSGSILRFRILPHVQGTTSMTYSVEVYADEPGLDAEKHVFSTRVTLACIDEKGDKCPLPKKEHFRSADP